MIVWSARAIANLEEQLRYVREDKPSAAEHMAFEIERQTNLLSNFPNVGRPGRRPGTRELVIGGTPYVAVYRVRKSNVEILRLLHGAQKWP